MMDDELKQHVDRMVKEMVKIHGRPSFFVPGATTDNLDDINFLLNNELVTFEHGSFVITKKLHDMDPRFQKVGKEMYQ
jgi:hypothetical protein